jgi:hypothetical protein
MGLIRQAIVWVVLNMRSKSVENNVPHVKTIGVKVLMA